MKKVFFIAALLLSSLLATAQVKISGEGIFPSYIELKFKRCIVQGDNGFLDLVVINHGKECTVTTGLFPGNESSILFYDDEGNVLQKGDGIASVDFAGQKGSIYSIDGKFPTDVPMALRVNIKGVNEFATQFTLIKIVFTSFDWGYAPVQNRGTIVLRNVPIERRD